jgi:hypothetical protein
MGGQTRWSTARRDLVKYTHYFEQGGMQPARRGWAGERWCRDWRPVNPMRRCRAASTSGPCTSLASGRPVEEAFAPELRRL